MGLPPTLRWGAATGGTASRPELKFDGALDINPVGVVRAGRFTGKRLSDVVADKEMTVARLDLRKAGDCVADNSGEFRAEKIAILGMDGIRSRAGSAGDGVKIVMRVGEPEGIAHESDAQARRWFEGEIHAEILDVLQRDHIHRAVKLVVRRK